MGARASVSTTRAGCCAHIHPQSLCASSVHAGADNGTVPQLCLTVLCSVATSSTNMMSLLLLQTILLSHLRASPYRLKHVIHASSTFLLFQAAIAAMELVFAFRVAIIHHPLCRRPASFHRLLTPPHLAHRRCLDHAS